MIERETTPCETCGKPTPMLGTKLCNNCWEVEQRLSAYMRAPKALEVVRKHLPKLDDWVDGHPDAWDYDAVLKEHEAKVEWSDTFVDGEGNTSPAGDMAEWTLVWPHGVIGIGRVPEIIARKAAAMFISLWLRGVSASFADKLMDGFICFLERQEQESLTFLAEIETYEGGKFSHLALTRIGMFDRACLSWGTHQKAIIDALGAVAPDEEIIVTFRRRKRA